MKKPRVTFTEEIVWSSSLMSSEGYYFKILQTTINTTKLSSFIEVNLAVWFSLPCWQSTLNHPLAS